MQDLHSFIRMNCRPVSINLEDSTRLESDLKISGDDALEFFESFSRAYQIPLQNIEFKKYFASEGTLAIYFFIFFGMRFGRKDIVIEDLKNCIELKEIDEKNFLSNIQKEIR
jgi:hypothetical protein